MCNVSLLWSIHHNSVITVPELGADWVGAPLGHTAHPHQRLLGEEDYVERGAQAHVAGARGRGGWRVRGWIGGARDGR